MDKTETKSTSGLDTNKLVVETQPEPLKYRYFCDGCTGIAFRSTNKMMTGKFICDNCGKEINTLKIENYFDL